MSKLAYAQEYLAIFTDELKRIFDDELIKKICCLKRDGKINNYKYNYFLGVDVAGLGRDECTYEILEMHEDSKLYQKENIIEKRNFTTDTSKKVLNLNESYDFKKIGIDDGGVGFGVFCELMDNEETKRKTEALNNARRAVDSKEKKSKRLMKEEMYFNLLALAENSKIFLLDDDEVKLSLSSIQIEDEKIFGFYSHITEGIIRAAYLASKSKNLNIWVSSIKI